MCFTEVTCRPCPPAPVEDSVEPDAPVPAEPEVPVTEAAFERRFRRRACAEFPVQSGDWDELAEFCVALAGAVLRDGPGQTQDQDRE